MVELDQKTKDILSEIISSFEGLAEYTNKRLEESDLGPIYLPNNTCPSGLVACDPTSDECPSDEHAVRPHVYTNEGKRCYSKVGVSAFVPESPEKFQVAVVEMTTKIAQLITQIKKKIEGVSCTDEGMTEDICGMKTTCAWLDGKCSTK